MNMTALRAALREGAAADPYVCLHLILQRVGEPAGLTHESGFQTVYTPSEGPPGLNRDQTSRNRPTPTHGARTPTRSKHE